MRIIPQAAKRSSKVLIALAGCATLLSVALPATAMAATASFPPPIPQSGDSCTVLPAGLQECTAIIGSGLDITSISGTFKNHSLVPENDVSIDFYGPNGNITSTASYNVPAGGTLGPFVWHNPTPTVNRPAGDYCTAASTGTTDCVDVHS